MQTRSVKFYFFQKSSSKEEFGEGRSGAAADRRLMWLRSWLFLSSSKAPRGGSFGRRRRARAANLAAGVLVFASRRRPRQICLFLSLLVTVELCIKANFVAEDRYPCRARQLEQ